MNLVDKYPLMSRNIDYVGFYSAITTFNESQLDSLLSNYQKILLNGNNFNLVGFESTDENTETNSTLIPRQYESVVIFITAFLCKMDRDNKYRLSIKYFHQNQIPKVDIAVSITDLVYSEIEWLFGKYIGDWYDIEVWRRLHYADSSTTRPASTIPVLIYYWVRENPEGKFNYALLRPEFYTLLYLSIYGEVEYSFTKTDWTSTPYELLVKTGEDYGKQIRNLITAHLLYAAHFGIEISDLHQTRGKEDFDFHTKPVNNDFRVFVRNMVGILWVNRQY